MNYPGNHPTLPYLLMSLVLSLCACGQPIDNKEPGTARQIDHASTVSMEEARKIKDEFADKDRRSYADMDFEAFKASVYREPFEGGVYIVNGDTPIANDKHLREFFEQSIKKKPPPLKNKELIVHQVGGLDAVWNQQRKQELLYCISDSFGSDKNAVVTAMQSATQAWENAANINFTYISGEDMNCNADNSAVLFDVRPVNVNGQYYARAFFPNLSREQRSVLIDNSGLSLAPGEGLTLTGILRHELGHALGFRHEHTRPSSGTCFEDEDWRPVTDYDPFSVMHYPHCNGLGDWTLTLTDADRLGAACVYGAAANNQLDLSQCPGGAPSQTNTAANTASQTKHFNNQSVLKNQENHQGPFKVTPGTIFLAEMSSIGPDSGDPDLYVRFDGQPLTSVYDCRPYLEGANESCELDVPQGKRFAFVMVHGFDEARNYNLHIKHDSN